MVSSSLLFSRLSRLNDLIPVAPPAPPATQPPAFGFAPQAPALGITPFGQGAPIPQAPGAPLPTQPPPFTPFGASAAQPGMPTPQPPGASGDPRNIGGLSAPGSTGGAMSSLGGEWANIDKLNDYIAKAAQATGVDPNQIKAVMKLESDGVWQTSPAGAIGYMQVMPFWGSDLGLNLNDPYQNILAGAEVLKQNLDASGGDFYEALRRYHGYGSDGYTTDTQYADIVTGNYDKLKSAGGGVFAGGGGGSAAGGNFSTVWGGGGDHPVSQEFGLTDFSQGNSMYDYSRAYCPGGCFIGHTGVDVSMNVGTPLYTPVSGTVVCAGSNGQGPGDKSSGCTAFNSEQCSSGNCGRFEIALDNGDMLILGHMSSITVQPGQRLNAGTFVGYSGSENGGHVHVEYRKSTPGATESGYTIVDPRTVLNGAPIAGGTVGGTTPFGGSGTPAGPKTLGQMFGWY